MGFRDQLVWRRDWTKHPNGWRMYVAFAVLWTVIAALYLVRGRLVGLGYLGLAVAAGLLARYTYRKARPRAR